MKTPNPKFIYKTLYFPEQEILAIGDLHLGYEEMFLEQGIVLPFKQLEKTKQEIKEIINKIKEQGNKLSKIILLGDIKHYFSFQKYESFAVKDFFKFLETFVAKENIIKIKGNHDKIQIGSEDYKNYYFDSGILFMHGDKEYLGLDFYDKSIKLVVISHIHPAVILKEGVKKEKYKTFLVGKYRSKKTIIVPSFFPIIQGTEINEEYSEKPNWSILTKKQLQNFKAFVIGEDKQVYEFGKLKDI